jgi:hypothetical protein
MALGNRLARLAKRDDARQPRFDSKQFRKENFIDYQIITRQAKDKI